MIRPTQTTRPGAFSTTVFKDRSGFLWVSSNESLDRFDPATETTTRFPIDRNGPDSVLGPVWHISQDRAGIVWLATAAGLHRLDPASGAFRHYAHDPADAASLSSSLVRSTYEDREGTLWVCTVAGLDAFDRRTEKVTERIRLNVPESLSVKALEDHAGVLWIIYCHDPAAGWPPTIAIRGGSRCIRSRSASRRPHRSAGRRESTKTPTATSGSRHGVAGWS